MTNGSENKKTNSEIEAKGINQLLIAAPSHQPTEDLCELLTLDIARMSKKK